MFHEPKNRLLLKVMNQSLYYPTNVHNVKDVEFFKTY